MFIKFLLLYLYIVSNYSFCESNFLVKMLHDTFVNIGTSIGTKPQKTISTLETIGMCTVIAGVAYCSIKGYQMATNTLPKSINDHLNDLENKMNNIDNKLNIMDNKLNIVSSQVDRTSKENDCIFDSISFVKKEVFEATKLLENQMCEIGNKLDENIGELKNELNINREISHKYVDEKLNVLKGTLQQEIQNLKQVINNVNNLTDEDKYRLQSTISELEQICINDLNKFTNEVRQNSINNFNDNILTTVPAMRRFTSRLTGPTLSTQVNKIIDEQKNDYDSFKSNVSTLKLDNHEVKPPIGYYKRYYELNVSQNNEVLTFTEISKNIISQEPTTIGKIARRVCYNIPVDHLFNLVITIGKTALNNSLSIIATQQILTTLQSFIPKDVPIDSPAAKLGEYVGKFLKDLGSGAYRGFK